MIIMVYKRNNVERNRFENQIFHTFTYNNVSIKNILE